MIISRINKPLNLFLDVLSMIVKKQNIRYNLDVSDRKMKFATEGYSAMLYIIDSPTLFLDDVFGLEYGFYSIRKTPEGYYDLAPTTDNLLFARQKAMIQTKMEDALRDSISVNHGSEVKCSTAMLKIGMPIDDFNFKILNKISSDVIVGLTQNHDVAFYARYEYEDQTTVGMCIIIEKVDYADQLALELEDQEEEDDE